MNKILTKVTALCFGLAMVAGVGVAVGSKSVGEAKATDTSWNAASEGFSNEQQLSGTSYSFSDSNVTISFASAVGNGHKWFNSGSAIRSYGGNSFTISCSTGNLTAITLSNNQSKEVTADVGTYSSNSWTGSAASVTFTVASGSGNFRTSTVSATYTGGDPGVTYTITYDANGGSGTAMEDTVAANPVVAACTYTAPSGKMFSEWNTSANGTGDSYDAGDKPGKNVDLYAIWVDAPNSVSLTASTTSDFVTPWSVDNAPSGIEASNRGWQWSGGKSAVVTYANEAAVEKVVVSATTNGSGSLAVTVGGNAFDDSVTISSTKTTYTFEGDDSGDVVITLTNSGTKSVYMDYIEIFFKSVDPDKQTLQINANGTDYDSATMNYSVGSALFYAKDEDNNDVTVASSWAISDSSIATLALNGNGIPYVTFVKGGTVTITATHPDYNAGTFSLTINVGELSTVVVSGSMSKTSYYVGETWNPAGLTVTADYEYGYHGDVTSEVTWSYDPAAPAVSVNSVVATASFGGKSGSSSSQSVSVSRTNPIQVLYTQESGASVDVYGYYVGFLDGTGPVIMDGDYGIVVYNKSADVSGYTANETILHVTGSISIYKGLYEIGSATMSIASGTFDYPDTPVVYSTTGNETYDYAARLTTVTGTPTLVSGSFDSAAGTADITMSFAVGTKSVQVFYKMAAQTADADAFAAVKDAVANSTEITVKGFTGWYNGFQVQMNGYIPAAVDYTAEIFAQDLLDQTDAVCTGYEEGDNNHDALVAIWSNLASNDKYPSLPSDQKTILAKAERDESGTVVEQAMARYDFLTGKYNLSNFINGRTPIVPAGSYVPSYENNLSSSSSITIIVIVAVASMTLLGVTLVIRKRKMN